MNNFDMYKLPLGLTEGVSIKLPQTDVVFRVILPASSNEEFQSKLISTMNMDIDFENAEMDMHLDAGAFQAAHKKIFFDDCIVGAENLPKEFDSAEAFFKEYRLAARYVYDRAVELAAVADKEVNAALGKSEPTLSGKSSGKVAKLRTTG